MARRISTAIVALLTLGGCIQYQPGGLATRRRTYASVRTVGCLDVAVEILAHPDVDKGSPVVDVNFGNVCHEGVTVDLSKLDVTASYASSPAMHRLRPYDPRHEIDGRLLYPVWTGHEAIEFDPEITADHEPTRVCVDVSRIVPSPSQAPPMCFRWNATYRALVPEERGT